MRARAALAACVLTLAACEDTGGDTLQGYLEAEYLQIAATEAGWLETVTVAEGDRAPAGMVLFTLDAVRERAAVAEARARLAQAEAELADLHLGARPEEIDALEAQLAEAIAARDLADLTEVRQERLVNTNAVSQARLDEARAAAAEAAARVERMRAELAVARLPARHDRIVAAEAAVAAARAALDQAGWSLDQRTVASPADALVDEVVRNPGEWVPANGTVVSLLPPGAIKVVFFIPEPQRATLTTGDALAVTCTGCPDGITARVTHVFADAEYTPPIIYSQETRSTLVFRAEASLDDGHAGLLPGQPVTLEVQP